MTSAKLSPQELSEQTRGKVYRYLEQLGKMTVLTRLLGYRALDAHRKRTDVNIDAEDAAVRRAMFGVNGTAQHGKAEDMGHTILGDVTNPTPIVIHSQPQQQSSGLGKVLAGAAIAAGLIGIPGAGVAGFLLNQYLQRPQVPVVMPRPTEDNTVDLGLSHWSDLKGLPE